MNRMSSWEEWKLAGWMRLHGYSLQDVVTQYDGFAETQWWSTDEVLNLQWRRLQKMIAHAYEQVPYYRTLFDRCGLAPQDIKTPADFRKIPVLTKAIIQERKDDLLARNFCSSRLIHAASGGSTGTPTRLVKDPMRVAVEVSNTWGYHHWMGWDVGDRSVRLWGSLDPPSFKRNAYGRVRQSALNELRVNVHRMGNASMKALADDIERFKPKIIIGYTNALHAFAQYLWDRKRTILGVSGIVTTAEMLFSHQRELIEKVFGCRVFNRYASQEIGQLAGECAERNLHLNVSNVYFEFLRGEEPVLQGSPGTIVVTDVHNYAMPFLRYQIGDMGTSSSRSCPCGRGLPLIDGVKGRLSDVIITPAGRKIFADDFAEIFYGLEDIKQFQIVQETERKLTLKIVKAENAGVHLETHILTRFREAVGEPMEIALEVVSAIPILPSGKHKICISCFSANAPQACLEEEGL